ncbi:hypothetical protein QFC22_006344 [Naganishia vaughanmartiniae]|uniref:Uncharacterized protein n=1 Tax=Naganishia vaughanmartiniae TaxID=1424756 RepID=A0ACC2WM70_9TREE|nr:hypothetical protein QFC22_006344 [Naganishia vaughanmartiniae]
MQCLHCPKIVKGSSTSNFLDHQRLRCTGLLEAHRLDHLGICCDVPSQSTIAPKSGELQLPFTHADFLAAVMKWVIVSGLPFTTIENPHLQKAFLAANPLAQVQSARSLARRLEDTWDVVNERIIDMVNALPSTLHFLHDSWTDTGRKNCYFGIYATYITNNFEYKEVLLRLLHMKGTHTGERMGDGMFDLFHNVFNVSNHLGPGTGDNASNNSTAADRLARLLQAESPTEQDGEDFVGCMCHIANIAALKYLSNESSLSTLEYAYAPENIPQIRVIGESAFWNADLEATPTEEDAALLDVPTYDEEENVDEGEQSNVTAMDASETIDLDEDQNEDVPVGDSPVDMVHQLAIYVHSSVKRKELFEKTFEALRFIQPSLKVFLNLTQVYSQVGAHAHRIIPDLEDAIDKLRRIHDHPSVTQGRRQSCHGAIPKLEKYLGRFVKNKWVCAAFALEPAVREQGLRTLLTEEYVEDEYFDSVVAWIIKRVEVHKTIIGGQPVTSRPEVKPVQKQRFNNKYASDRFKSGRKEIQYDINDPWACYNSDDFLAYEDEPVLDYWKRMSKVKEMRPLALVARDILGLASSSASVERLFSHAGHVLGKKRGSLSARLLAK